MTTSETPSEPESLDLEYDLWQGQFEFVGSSQNTSKYFIKSQSIEDLNLKDYVLTDEQAILNNKEKVLRLRCSDLDDSDSSSEFSIETTQEYRDDLSGNVGFLLFYKKKICVNIFQNCDINNFFISLRTRRCFLCI